MFSIFKRKTPKKVHSGAEKIAGALKTMLDDNYAKVGIFFGEIVHCFTCSCDENMCDEDYCELLVTLDKATAEVTFTPI